MGDAGRRYVIYLKAGSYTPTPAMGKVVGNPSYGIRAINDWNRPNPSFAKSYGVTVNKVKSRSDSVISTVSLEHAIAGKDTDKNITATLNGQDITRHLRRSRRARRLGRCNHPQRANLSRMRKGMLSSTTLACEVAITLTKTRKRVKI